MDQLVLGAVLPELQRSTIAIAGTAAFVLLMALSAFFSSSEIAMFSLARHRIEALAAEGVAGADRVEALRREPHRMLVTILVGNNLANIAMSSIATGLLALYVSPSESILIATLGVTSLVLLFSESAPKSYAVENAESWALRVARPLQLTQLLLYPIVVVFDRLTRLLNRLTGAETAIETAYVTRSELRELVEAGERQGVLAETEGAIIQRTFGFPTTIAREVMVPRGDVAGVDAAASVDEAIERCVATGHTRLPVYDGDLETVLGVVHVVDLVRDRYYGEGDASDLLDLTRPTILVPDTRPVDELLATMQRDRVQLAVVMDEFGSVDGVVTVEDIVEELVGEILDPTEEAPIVLVDDATAMVAGDVTVEALNDALGTDLPVRGAYETVAGLLLERAGRLVGADETVAVDGVWLSPTRVEGDRIRRLRVEREAEEPA